jgi:release factor glutamine methyltransferase
MPPLASAVPAWQAVLQAAGFPPDVARRDAVLLARHHVGWDAAEWLTQSREVLPQHVIEEIDTLIRRRASHEPVAYIVGEREFFGRPFLVNRHVLIPRPETELLVDEALRDLRAPHPLPRRDRLPLVVDVGTGSGCIAITLAQEAAPCRIIATDTSTAALEVAKENARLMGASERIEFRHAALLGEVSGPVDLIVSNPPYVAEADRATLPREVEAFEPAAALFGGADGLDVICELAAAAAPALTPGGSLAIEIGQGQEQAVRAILERHAFAIDRVAADLQGIPRVVVARRLG